MTPGRLYERDVKIWPISIVVPQGYRIALEVRGKDYEHPGKGSWIQSFVNELKGCSPFLHNDFQDRPEPIFGGQNRVHGGGKTPSIVLVPIIPRRDA